MNWWTLKTFVVASAITVLAGVAVMFAIGLAYPEPVSNTALGPDWQCSRQAFVWTTCRRQKGVQSAFVHLAEEPTFLRPRT